MVRQQFSDSDNKFSNCAPSIQNKIGHSLRSSSIQRSNTKIFFYFEKHTYFWNYTLLFWKINFSNAFFIFGKFKVSDRQKGRQNDKMTYWKRDRQTTKRENFCLLIYNHKNKIDNIFKSEKNLCHSTKVKNLILVIPLMLDKKQFAHGWVVKSNSVSDCVQFFRSL